MTLHNLSKSAPWMSRENVQVLHQHNDFEPPHPKNRLHLWMFNFGSSSLEPLGKSAGFKPRADVSHDSRFDLEIKVSSFSDSFSFHRLVRCCAFVYLGNHDIALRLTEIPECNEDALSSWSVATPPVEHFAIEDEQQWLWPIYARFGLVQQYNLCWHTWQFIRDSTGSDIANFISYDHKVATSLRCLIMYSSWSCGPTWCFQLLQGFQQCLGFKKKTSLPKRKNGNSSFGKNLSSFWKSVYSDLSVQEKTNSFYPLWEWEWFLFQVIQFVTFLSPIVGGHVNNLWLHSGYLTIPKRSPAELPG